MNLGLPDHRASMAQAHRRRLLRLLLGFTVFFGVIFIVINLLSGDYAVMAIEIVVTGFALSLLFIVARTPHLHRWSLIYLITLYSGTMYALTNATTSITVFSWVMVMPMVAHLLLGRILGGVISVFYVALAGLIFVWRFGASTVFDSPGAIADIATVTACSFLFSHVYESSREQSESQLSEMALTDSLTGLPNRTRLERYFEHTHRHQRPPLSLAMIDLDYFKRINDENGHDAGDAALRGVARAMRKQLKPGHLLCRLGGEEFCLLMPTTDAERAREISEQFRATIEQLACRHRDVTLVLTASIGIATTTDNRPLLAPLLHISDQNLYAAKQQGRNRVVG